MYLGNRTWIAHSVLVGNIAITNTYADISQAVLQNVNISNINELTEIKKSRLTDCVIKDIKNLQIEYTSLKQCNITNYTTVNLYEQELENENVDKVPCYELIPD